MAYCTNQQVAEEFKDISWGTGTAISPSRVDRLISESDAHIDAKIGLIYVTPVTGTNSIVLLRRISIALTASRIREIMGVKAPGSTDSQQSKNASEFDPEKALQEIVEQKMILSDATLKSTDGAVRSYVKTNGVERVFKMDEDQW